MFSPLVVFFSFFFCKPSDALELRQLCRIFRKRTPSEFVDSVQDERDVDETGDEATENDNETQSISQSEISQDFLADEVCIFPFHY